MKSLNHRQQRFVEEYLLDLNGTKAAARAGYSKRSAVKQAYHLMRRPEVREAIDSLRAVRSERTLIAGERVMKALEQAAFADPRVLFKDGEISPEGLEAMARAGALKLKVRRREAGGGGQDSSWSTDPMAKLQALGRLGQMLGLFDTRSEWRAQQEESRMRTAADQAMTVLLRRAAEDRGRFARRNRLRETGVRGRCGDRTPAGRAGAMGGTGRTPGG